MTPGAARVALARWHCEGFVAPAGPRLGLWYNLLRDAGGPEVHLGTVLNRTFGSVVVIGPSILNAEGWTTQAPRMLTVAVPEARRYPIVEGAAVYGRPREWFARVQAAWRRTPRGVGGLPTLPPDYALADALRHRDCLHHLAPDDLEIPDGSRSGSLLRAFEDLAVPPDRYLPYLDASGIACGPAP
jgi:hypothetical protein